MDSNNVCLRTVGLDLTNAQGTQIGTVHSFLSSLVSAIDRFKIDQCIIVWDRGKSEWRSKMVENYKSNRPTPSPIHEDVFRQISVLQEEVLPNLPVLQLGLWGYEADDVIYAITKAVDPKDEIFLYSNDSDFRQLLNRVTIWTGSDLYTTKTFKDYYGFPASKYIEYKSLVGDSSDNIKGVRGVGDKTARIILKEYGSVEAFAASDHKKAHLVVEDMEIFKRNLEVIGLENFPDFPKVKAYVEEELKNFTPVMDEKKLHQLFMRKMQPIFGKWVMYRLTLRRLLR